MIDYLSIINKLFGQQCKYYNNCLYSNSNSPVCTQDGGDYYGPDRKCGQYRFRVF